MSIDAFLSANIGKNLEHDCFEFIYLKDFVTPSNVGLFICIIQIFCQHIIIMLNFQINYF